MITKNSTKQIVVKMIIEKEPYEPGEFIEVDPPALPEKGEVYFCYGRNYTGPNLRQREPEELCFSDDSTLIDEGMSGNADHNHKRFHGWRGTTNDISIHAYGVRQCLDSKRIEYAKSVHYIFKFGPDLAEGKE